MHKILVPYFLALTVTPPTHSLEGTLLVCFCALYFCSYVGFFLSDLSLGFKVVSPIVGQQKIDINQPATSTIELYFFFSGRKRSKVHQYDNEWLLYFGGISSDGSLLDISPTPVLFWRSLFNTVLFFSCRLTRLLAAEVSVWQAAGMRLQHFNG